MNGSGERLRIQSLNISFSGDPGGLQQDQENVKEVHHKSQKWKVSFETLRSGDNVNTAGKSRKLRTESIL